MERIRDAQDEEDQDDQRRLNCIMEDMDEEEPEELENMDEEEPEEWVYHYTALIIEFYF